MPLVAIAAVNAKDEEYVSAKGKPKTRVNYALKCQYETKTWTVTKSAMELLEFKASMPSTAAAFPAMSVGLCGFRDSTGRRLASLNAFLRELAESNTLTLRQRDAYYDLAEAYEHAPVLSALPVLLVHVRAAHAAAGAEGASPFTVYQVDCLYEEHQYEDAAWTVEKRYSQFEVLAKDMPPTEAPFPEKNVFGTLISHTVTLGGLLGDPKSPSQLEARRAALDRWLAELAAHLELKGGAAPLDRLHDFLGVRPHLAQRQPAPSRLDLIDAGAPRGYLLCGQPACGARGGPSSGDEEERPPCAVS